MMGESGIQAGMKSVASPFAFLTVLAVLPAAAQPAASGRGAAEPLPALARALIDAAYRTEDPAQVAAVANAAKEVFPGFEAAIGAYADARRAALESPLLTGGTGDEVIVTAEAPREKETPKVDSRPDEVDFKPGKAPEFLGLGPWTGKVAASGVIATGNSRNAAAGLQVEAHRKVGALTHHFTGLFDYGKSKGVATQQRWGAGHKLDIKLENGTYGYARAAYDEDAFSGFDYKLFGGLGAGRHIYAKDNFKWKIEGGPGYQYAPIDDSREIDQRFAVYASSEVDWVIRDGLKFEQDLSATWTSPTTTLVSQSSLNTVLTDTISAGMVYLYRYETHPPAGKVNEDTTFRLNLTYGF